MVEFVLKVCVVQVAAVVREPDVAPRRGHHAVERLLGHWAALLPVSQRMREPGALEQAPDALLFHELQGLMVELIPNLAERALTVRMSMKSSNCEEGGKTYRRWCPHASSYVSSSSSICNSRSLL